MCLVNIKSKLMKFLPIGLMYIDIIKYVIGIK